MTKPYTIIDRVSVKEGSGHCREQLVKKYGATSEFIKSNGASYEVYTYEGRYFVIDQQFSKRKGQLFDCFLCEVTLNEGFTFPH